MSNVPIQFTIYDTLVPAIIDTEQPIQTFIVWTIKLTQTGACLCRHWLGIFPGMNGRERILLPSILIQAKKFGTPAQGFRCLITEVAIFEDQKLLMRKHAKSMG